MDDYISREAVETFLRSRNYCLDTDADIEYVIERFREEIPPADVRSVPPGEWWPAKDGYYGHVMCSNCHKIESRETDFCPNCGAKMGGEKTK